MRKQQFTTMGEALGSETGRFFRASLADGKFECGDPQSIVGRIPPDEHLTFDVSNNTLLANIGIRGDVRHLATYRGSYAADDWLPGVWWYKDLSDTGPYSFSLSIRGATYDLAEVDWPVETSLLGNMFPITRTEGGGVGITILSFAPISGDGAERPAALFHGLSITNVSNSALYVEVIPPKGRDTTSVYLADGVSAECSLDPGESRWIPAVIARMPGEETMGEIAGRSSLRWFNETWAFFGGMVGHLEIPDDPFTADFFQRMVNQCFGGVCLDGDGEVVGANWASYPPTKQVWMKDMGYTVMPSSLFDPELFKKCLLWFTPRSLRSLGDKSFEGFPLGGGVNYSICNALTPVTLAGLYYQATGDGSFFESHPEVLERCLSLLEELLASRSEGPYLFDSVWISDGPSRGDYHTGSNVVAWFSFHVAGIMCAEVLGDDGKAGRYADIAERIRADLNSRCIAEGPMGAQYTEGVNIDGTAIFDHDGEETDTTLMPFYGFTSYDDPAYQNHMRVAMTPANCYYTPHTDGIEDSTWIDPVDNPGIDATFPGYMTGLAGVATREEWNGEEGRMTVIRRLADADGAIWWWPYKYGKVVRAFEIEGTNVGKSGWSASVFIMHFVSQILGLKYDGRNRHITFKPFSPAGDFEWSEFRLGNGSFSVGFTRGRGVRSCYVENRNNFEIETEVELILEAGIEKSRVEVTGGVITGDKRTGRFFDSSTAIVGVKVSPGGRAEISAVFG